tara:strand:- start:91 stop:309 length:219 start_codon:yes stop_codon:yes gene_type:complete
MEQIVDQILKEVTIIKWSVICVAVSTWGVTAYLLLRDLTKDKGKTMGKGKDKPKREKKKPKKEKKKKKKKKG